MGLALARERKPSGRGGWRPGAGRKPGPRPRVLHRVREPIPGRSPVLVTVRLKEGLPSLRSRRLFRAFKDALAKCCVRPGFRVVHYSIQKDQVLLLVEAQGKDALRNGMMSVGSRLARTVNRVFERRGPVLHGRFAHRVLRTAREVRDALAYVLLHDRRVQTDATGHPPPVELDPGSSGCWFDGWTQRPPGESPEQREVAAPRTRLLADDWRRCGLIDPTEVPPAVVQRSAISPARPPSPG